MIWETKFYRRRKQRKTFPDEMHNAQILLSLALKHNDITILQDILEDLHNHSLKKWEKISVGDLYPTLLTDTSRLNKQCTAQELSIISRAIEHKTGRKFYIDSGCLYRDCFMYFQPRISFQPRVVLNREQGIFGVWGDMKIVTA